MYGKKVLLSWSQIYRSYIFLLCYERTQRGKKVKLELQVRDKLTGALLAEKVLKTRTDFTEHDPSFTDRMEVGVVLATLPQSNKIVVARGKHSPAFIKNGPTPASFSFIFGLFRQTIQFLQQSNVIKCHVHPVYGTGIQTHDLSNLSCLP